jgi:tetratricopeptide (TPR) repeat protein
MSKKAPLSSTVKRITTFLGLASVLFATGPELDHARKLYNQTDFDQSLQILRAIPNKDAAVYELMGRNYYGQSDFKRATEALERAFSAEPANAELALWLGRAYGRRAETSSPFTAPGHASRARQYFEKSVELNPRYLDALSDLFEYYTEAPGFLGGGMDKAQAIAEKIAALSPAEGLRAQAQLAEKRKEYASAERQLRRAIEVAPQQVGRFIDLARFLAKQGRVQEADQSLAHAEKVAPDSPRLLYARADIYIKCGRNLGVAKDLLKRYLSCKLTPDDPPRSEAQKLLRQVQGS